MRPILQIMLASISLYLPALSAHQGDHSSIAELDALLAISPDAPSLLMTRGAAYTRTGQWDKAEQDIRLAKQIDTHINVEFALHLATNTHQLQLTTTWRNSVKSIAEFSFRSAIGRCSIIPPRSMPSIT